MRQEMEQESSELVMLLHVDDVPIDVETEDGYRKEMSGRMSDRKVAP